MNEPERVCVCACVYVWGVSTHTCTLSANTCFLQYFWRTTREHWLISVMDFSHRLINAISENVECLHFQRPSWPSDQCATTLRVHWQMLLFLSDVSLGNERGRNTIPAETRFVTWAANAPLEIREHSFTSLFFFLIEIYCKYRNRSFVQKLQREGGRKKEKKCTGDTSNG